MVQIALTLFPGVSGDECEAFTAVLRQLPEADVIGVGAEVGPVAGIGPDQQVDAVFADVTEPDVVLVPGGLGVRRTAGDDELARWLQQVEPTCRWMVGSSTGTVVLAAAGLLDDRPVATHWLAGPLLESYGSSASRERIVEYGRLVTCEGQVTAVDVALLLTARLFGPEWASRARAGLPRREWPEPPPPRMRLRDWWRERYARVKDPGPGRPRNPELQVSEWVDEELVEMQVDDAWSADDSST